MKKVFLSDLAATLGRELTVHDVVKAKMPSASKKAKKAAARKLRRK